MKSVVHVKPVFQAIRISFPGFMQSGKNIITVIPNNRNTVIGAHAHVGQPTLQLGQAFQRSPSGPSRTGYQHAALINQGMVVRCVTPAKPVKKALKLSVMSDQYTALIQTMPSESLSV